MSYQVRSRSPHFKVRSSQIQNMSSHVSPGQDKVMSGKMKLGQLRANHVRSR